MSENHRQTYKEEAAELLTELESSLLELEETPDNMEVVGRVFRAMHTIKGSGAMFGFDDIAAFTHEVETVFDLVRNGKLLVSKELVDLTLRARDYIRELLDASDSSLKADPAVGQEIIAGLKRLVPAAASTVAPASPKAPAAGGGDARDTEATYRIRFKPSPELFVTGTNPLPLLNELRDLGKCHVIAHTDTIPMLGEIDPEVCFTFWDIILTTNKGVNAIRDVFIFVEDSAELKIDLIDESWGAGAASEYKRLGDILIERGDVRPEDIERVLGKQKRLGELLVDEGVAAQSLISSALAEQRHVKEVREKRQTVESAASVRVPSERLDSLVNLVGELVTVQARLSQTSARRNDAELVSIAEEVERLTSELRDKTMGIRMLQIGTSFSKFKRLVRDLSKELGKEIELTTSGAETELDKTVIDKLNDPLVHLIRNCIDHGIELPEEREGAGKPRAGNVHLSAMHSGAHVLIDIADDGRGLDAGAIRAKGIEKGLIAPDATLSEKELFSLILAPGFSTAKTVTNVSGRGVGMDVVKRTLDELRGAIEISSWKGQGSTISLKLPLTLAIIEGLLVRIRDDFFVLPLSAVEECVELTARDSGMAQGRNIANVRGQIVPYIRLREQFTIDGTAPEIEQIVIVRVDGNRVGFVVDSVIGEHQTVIKNLGRAFRQVEGISGATILGDGTVALILDTAHLVAAATMQEKELI